MDNTNIDISRLFKLARIKETDKDLASDIKKVIDYVALITDVDFSKVDQVTRSGNLREDVSEKSLSIEQVLSNSKLTEDNLIIAPKVLKGEDE